MEKTSSETLIDGAYVHSQDVINHINGNFTGTNVNYGKRTVGSITKHLARRRLLRDEVDLGLPEGYNPVMKGEEGDLLHVSLLEYSLNHQTSIEGLSEQGKDLLASFVRDFLPQQEPTSGLE